LEGEIQDSFDWRMLKSGAIWGKKRGIEARSNKAVGKSGKKKVEENERPVWLKVYYELR